MYRLEGGNFLSVPLISLKVNLQKAASRKFAKFYKKTLGNISIVIIRTKIYLYFRCLWKLKWKMRRIGQITLLE